MKPCCALPWDWKTGAGRVVVSTPMCQRYRYVVEDVGLGPDTGTGLVFDTETGMHWLRFGSLLLTHDSAIQYCTDKGMRLPTKEEALAIADDNFCRFAWPAGWSTWTSTKSATGEQAWCVWHWGSLDPRRVSLHGQSTLCVR